jgi:hypothetical protein
LDGSSNQSVAVLLGCTGSLAPPFNLACGGHYSAEIASGVNQKTKP